MPDRETYECVARAIASYLARRQRPDGGFPGPDSYGVAFSLWLWSRLGAEFEPFAQRARDRLQARPPESHGEFNAYALLQCREQGRTGDPVLRRVPFGRRHSANWMLLRAVCRSQAGPPGSALRGRLEARGALLWHARRGFIRDRPGARSFAYHAFCGALLADLYHLRGYRWAGLAAAEAAQFILPFVLPNGDALYVGRGQQQVFGYGALLYLLEAGARLTGRDDLRDGAERAFDHLMSFQRADGSFPLVLRDGEPAEPWTASGLPGWYTYNRYADYLPFLGCFLLKAASVNPPSLGGPAGSTPHPAFRIWRGRRYVAVLARPGGASTNGLAFPYVCVDGTSLFPCSGGEGASPPEDTPLPYGVLADGRPYVFRDRLAYRVTESGLEGEGRLVRHVRRLHFAADGFVCRDEITFRRSCALARLVPANFLFRSLEQRPDGDLATRYRDATAILHLEPRGEIHRGAAVTASGPLAALRLERAPLDARRGEMVSAELRVRFP